MKVTSLTIAGLLVVILAIHAYRSHVFGKLWAAMSGEIGFAS